MYFLHQTQEIQLISFNLHETHRNFTNFSIYKPIIYTQNMNKILTL